MAAKKTKRRKMDRKLVAATQGHELDYAAKKAGKHRGDVRQAVKKVGRSRRKVEEELQGQ